MGVFLVLLVFMELYCLYDLSKNPAYNVKFGVGSWIMMIGCVLYLLNTFING